jgi:hypothetical protein
MSAIDDALALAADKWVQAATAAKMVRIMAPHAKSPYAVPYRLEDARKSGAITTRPIFRGSDGRARGARYGEPPQYEWSLKSLILKLLQWREAEKWPVSVEMILRLATTEPDDLDKLAVERLMAPAATPKNKGGAPDKYPWDEIAVAFGAWLHEVDGRVNSTPKLQREAIEGFALDLGCQDTPDARTIGPYLKRWCAAYRTTQKEAGET